jgi:hypothetical protein
MSATIWPIVPAPDDDECGAVGGMNIDRGNRSTPRKPAAVSRCPPHTLYDLTWDRTRAAAELDVSRSLGLTEVKNDGALPSLPHMSSWLSA